MVDSRENTYNLMREADCLYVVKDNNIRVIKNRYGPTGDITLGGLLRRLMSETEYQVLMYTLYAAADGKNRRSAIRTAIEKLK